MGKIRLWFFLGPAILLAFLYTFPTFAEGSITIKAIPETLKLSLDKPSQATLVVTNPTTETLQGLTIQTIPIKGVEVSVTPKEAVVLSGQSTAIWQVTVTQTVPGVVSDTIQFQSEYTRTSDTGQKYKDFLSIGLPVASQKGIDPGEAITVTTVSAFSELNDYRPGYIYLDVKNISGVPITITAIEVANRPDFIQLSTGSKATPIPKDVNYLPYPKNVAIPASESHLFSVYIVPKGQIRTGKQLLLFNVYFSQDVNGETLSGSTTTSHEFDVKVFGEGEVLGALTNVTSFLVLPGFLMVVMAVMIWRLFVPNPYRELVSVDFKTPLDPRFWVIAVTLSLLMAWQIYPTISGFIPNFGQRNYLVGYNFQDILYIWLISIGSGTTFSFLSAVGLRGYRFWQASRQEAENRIKFRETDLPMDILDKLVDQGYDQQQFREAKLKKDNQTVYLLDKDIIEKDHLWVAPRILIFVSDSELYDGLLDTINSSSTSLKELVDAIKAGLAAKPKPKLQTPMWNKDGTIKTANYLPRSDLDIPSRSGSIFDLKIAD